MKKPAVGLVALTGLYIGVSHLLNARTNAVGPGVTAVAVALVGALPIRAHRS